MGYQPIEDYGLIGNMHTAALVGRNGSIDWLCLPHFDSPSIFAAILDDKRGGCFRIAPTLQDTVGKQIYWPDTNVLITRFLLSDGVVEVIDYMPVGVKKGEPGFRQLVRRVQGIRGCVPLRVECTPAFNFARDPHQVTLNEQGALFQTDHLSIELTTSVPLRVNQKSGGVSAELKLKQDETALFVLRQLQEPHQGARVQRPDSEQALFEQTVSFWHRWLSQCTYKGRWREMVQRSALVLKLLTFEPTGALVAAATCSLPEAVPGPRNWDYRYTWLRDAAFSLYALLRIGFTEEAAAFMRWLEQRCHERKPDGGLQVMYGIRGEHELTEMELSHLSGYRDCRPVRVGNAAFNQLQLDIYGELMDSIYLYNKYGAPISWDMWVELRGLVEWVCQNWREPDDGIWETRGGRRQFTYSKLMCWVCLDRALRLADKRSLPADRGRWSQIRDDIFNELMKCGWSDKRHAFVQFYGSETLDASNLMMPMVFFMAPNDPRMLKTLDATLQDPSQGGLFSASLVYRYNARQFNDGLSGMEGTFNLCTFWLVEALTRAGRSDPNRLDQSRLIFEKMLGYANHLGLFAEETGSHGQALGNYPQALTHLSLISAAYNLDRTLGTATR